MNDRQRLLLRTMLWALGLTAAAGVLAVFTGADELVVRVLLTGLTAAIASGLLIPAMRKIDQARTRPAALFASVIIMVVCLLTLLEIWLASWFSWWEFRVGMSIVVFATAGAVASQFVYTAGAPTGRIAALLGLAFTALAVVLILSEIWLERWTPSTWRLGEMGAVVCGFGPLLLASLVGVGVPPGRPWRWLGVAAAALAWVMAWIGLWLQTSRFEGFFASIISVAVVVGYANLVLYCPLLPAQRWLRGAAIALLAFTALQIDLLTFESLGYAHLPMVERAAAASGILTCCATLALLVLARLNRQVDYQPEKGKPLLDLQLVCPRCKKKQTLPIGASQCAACGLRITINVEEPACPKCGYSLYGLTSDRCPECGWVIIAGSQPEPSS